MSENKTKYDPNVIDPPIQIIKEPTLTLNQSNIEDQRLNYHKLKIIFVAIFRTIKISNLIVKNNIRVIVVSTQTHCYNSGIACRIGLTKKLKF